MNPLDLDDFTAKYFRSYYVHNVQRQGTRTERLYLRDNPQEDPDEWLHTALYRGPDGADEAWPVISALVERAPDDAALAYVAAGPLEDLIRLHGEHVEDRIVEQARQDARFREALRGVWGWQSAPARLRERVMEVVGALHG